MWLSETRLDDCTLNSKNLSIDLKVSCGTTRSVGKRSLDLSATLQLVFSEQQSTKDSANV
jgi:hypothetical protein